MFYYTSTFIIIVVLNDVMAVKSNNSDKIDENGFIDPVCGQWDKGEK